MKRNFSQVKRIFSLAVTALVFGAFGAFAQARSTVVEKVDGGLKITCPQDAPNYRIDLLYNARMPYNNSSDACYTIDASQYKVFAITFQGERPKSGVLKLKNIGLADDDWIKGKEGYSLSENGWKDVTGADGNHTYYWVIGGDKWTGIKTISKMEVLCADIKDPADKSFIIKNMNWYRDPEELGAALSAIPSAETADEAVSPVYYNLQGVRIDNPAAGLYIRVVGDKATKVVIP